MSEPRRDADERQQGFTNTKDGRPLKIAFVGVSANRVCGVRDHAALLVEALGRENVSCSWHWLSREAASLRLARSDMRAWTRGLAGELQAAEADVVLLHYSVFALSYRGLPLFVRPTLSAIRASGIPLVSVLHEFAYPWRYGGWRGSVWAVSQRAALIDAMRVSSAAIVTADFWVPWLDSRRWLPRRRVDVAPVFSNLPPPRREASPDGAEPVAGLFGYSYQSAAVSLVIDALGLLLERGVRLRLSLLGAPGPSSPAGEQWLAAARARGVEQALSFSGRLAAQTLSDTLARCDVLLFADSSGPSSRKTTLAASLASGRPLVAIDGPRAWPELLRSGAAEVVPPSSRALADSIGALLADDARREELGALGHEFAEQKMGVARTVDTLTSLLGDVVVGAGRGPAHAPGGR